MMSDDERLQYQALPLDEMAEDEFDLEIVPTSGTEYLRRVRLEAKQCPGIVVADIDTSAFTGKQTIKVSSLGGFQPSPKGYAPTLAWQKMQVKDFSEVRNKLARYKARSSQQNKDCKPVLPAEDDVESWCRFCFGKLHLKQRGKPEKDNQPMEEEEMEQVSAPPTLNIVTSMDQSMVTQVLEYHINWFEATGFSHEQGRWFYALLANLEKPLVSETCSLIRTLARNCANLRATLEGPEDESLIPLNLIICLVARYFEQGDLADTG